MLFISRPKLQYVLDRDRVQLSVNAKTIDEEGEILQYWHCAFEEPPGFLWADAPFEVIHHVHKARCEIDEISNQSGAVRCWQ